VQNMMTEFLGQGGPQPVATMKARMVAVQQVKPPPGLNKFQKDIRKKNIAKLIDILDKTTLTQLDMSKELKLRLMTKNLNQMKKEHDLVFIRPASRTIGQFEVKAMQDKANGEVLEALKQLRGGRDELARVHGHVLDHQWTYVGAVCLPNLPIHLKAEVVRELGICHSCSSYLLVGPMKAPVENLLRNLFPPSSSFPDESVWRPQYEAVTSRLLAMDHLVKPIPDVQRITGRKDPIVAGYTEVDRVVDPITSTAQDIKDMSKEKHIGSPTSIIFLTGDQRRLWGETRLLLLADYSTGKTTLLKSKAVSLARKGEAVTYIFLGGPRDMEAVMTVATKLQMAQYRKFTTLSLHDLVNYYNKQTRLSYLRPAPSPLTLLQFYLGKEKPSHVFVDEAPFETQWDLMRWLATVLLTYLPYSTAVVFFLFGAAFFTMIICLAVLTNFLSHGYLLLFIPFVAPLLLCCIHIRATSFACILAALCAADLLVITYCSTRFAACFGIVVRLWPPVGFLILPFSLSSTGSLLISLPDLLPPSATLWIALHSAPLTDTHMAGGMISSKALEDWRRSLTKTFSCPFLQCNLRNTPQVFKILDVNWLYYQGDEEPSISDRSKALPVAGPPPLSPSLSTSPPTSPILLPLSSPSKLPEAMAHLLTVLLPTPLVDHPVVVLMDDPAYHQQVEDALTQENIPVVTYLNPSHLASCETFLSNPQGVFLTTGALFSGMEAITTVVVQGRGLVGEMKRSHKLRAIEQIAIIDFNPNFASIRGAKADGKFTSCNLAWGAKVYKCNTCPSNPLLCPHCVLVCHGDCETEVAMGKVQNLLLNRTCSCHSSNKCKLPT